jgi:hypothetical protein
MVKILHSGNLSYSCDRFSPLSDRRDMGPDRMSRVSSQYMLLIAEFVVDLLYQPHV